MSGSGTTIPPRTFATYMESLRQHAIVLDNASSTNRVARRANLAKQCKGGDRNKESKKDGKDVTDPTVFLNREEYAKLTAHNVGSVTNARRLPKP